MSSSELIRDAVLRVGEVSAVEGRRIFVRVDSNKNLSDMFLDGDILTNIAVNSYVEIRKGFLSIIGRVEGERIQSASQTPESLDGVEPLNLDSRILTVSLTGFIDELGEFTGGTKELPLIGNEAYLLTRDRIMLIHNLATEGPSISIATLFGDDIPIEFPVDGLVNSHIAIFGNTGSGKTNTLAALYSDVIRVLSERNPEKFLSNARFVLLDFNGEYGGEDCLTARKTVFNLSTRGGGGDRLPIEQDGLLDIEVLSILAEATEKTQKPFLRRTLKFMRQVDEAGNSDAYMKQVLRKKVSDTLQLADKARAFLLLDYFEQILPEENPAGEVVDLQGDLEWHNTVSEFKLRDGGNTFLRQSPARIADTALYQHVENYALSNNIVDNLIAALYTQLVSDVLTNRAQNDHIAPLINRLKSKRDEIAKLFRFDGIVQFWERNVVVVNLHDVNLEMKKTIPLLLARRLYAEQKAHGQGKTLSLIVDEAHNILSRESSRESETWKDYRLETFEEIIKEGRKFGVFVTLASQRPSDISPTIASQSHNYFIHRLINQLDLKMISTAVSYIDRVTEESIPTLPVGTCVFSGVITQMPLKLDIREVPEAARPKSSTRSFSKTVPRAQE